jgi:hypothetical protein
MNTRTLSIGMVVALMAACGEETPIAATSPSPLLSAKPDQLWILARASRVGDGRKCRDLYLHPDDPRYQGLGTECDFWARNYADYLRLNGFPEVEVQHLKDPAYWQWYSDTRAGIQDCRNRLGVLSVEANVAAREEHYRQRNQCDPYDDAVNNKGLPSADLEVNYP